MSFYLPFESWSTTSTTLSKFWLKWITNGALPPSVGPISSFQVNQRALVIAGPNDDSLAAVNVLRGYGMPHDVFNVGSGDFNLEVTPNSVGAYSFVVLMASMNDLTASQQTRLRTYLNTYNIRLVKLNDFPDPATGVSPYDGSGTSVNQPAYLSPDGAQLAVAAGIQPSILLNTLNLWRIPGRITNSALAKPILMLRPAGSYPVDTVGAAIITYPFYQQLSFYVPSGSWSLTSMVLGHIWFTWGTRGFYPGYRRIMFSTQVDDFFLSTPTQVGQPLFRINAADMNGVQRWQTNLNTRMNAGSSFKLDIIFNGNGVYMETAKALASIQAVQLDPIAYVSVNKEFKKPLGTGIDVWAPINLNPYSSASVAANLNNFLQYDPLFNFIYTNQEQYFLGSHTFTHEDLNNCTYRDAFNEITVNQNFARGVGFDTKPNWSKHSLVSPGISGIFNGDAIRAWRDAGLTSVVGDITRPNINNPNPYWPFITTDASSNNPGFTVIPRASTNIFFNASTPAQNEAVYRGQYGQTQTFKQIVDADASRAVFRFMNLYWDAFMFHQGNLRNSDLSTTVNPPPGPASPLSTYNSGIALPGSRNGATAAYTGGNISILGSWVESVVQLFQQYTNWPMVTYKMDDMEDLYNQRFIRENAGVVVNVNSSPDGFTQFTVRSSRACVYPVTFPTSVVAGNIVNMQAGWRTEKLGADPLTLWIPLDGSSTVTVNLNVLIPN
ncbi:hypothetical protein HDV05_008046 [Chytridiales sp. JEL 0842]|nr:hypothetical protein HDV05_008046 [Chytridiales sp. JEL 0842]